MKRFRLDQVLVEKKIFKSREQAKRSIMAGEVWSGTLRFTQPSAHVPRDIPIEVRPQRAIYVSRGGEKLEHALKTFGVSVCDLHCLDIGASSGGFTDCLLQHGAAHVFAVDVGYGQLDVGLRNHPRVSVVERCNARTLTRERLLSISSCAYRIDVVCIDVSFISLKTIVARLVLEFPEILNWILLFKPQFEVGPEHIKKGGKVKNLEIVQVKLGEFIDWMKNRAFKLKHDPVQSPIAGKKSGNVEYLLLFGRSNL